MTAPSPLHRRDIGTTAIARHGARAAPRTRLLVKVAPTARDGIIRFPDGLADPAKQLSGLLPCWAQPKPARRDGVRDPLQAACGDAADKIFTVQSHGLVRGGQC